jgi:hypothetical protein
MDNSNIGSLKSMLKKSLLNKHTADGTFYWLNEYKHPQKKYIVKILLSLTFGFGNNCLIWNILNILSNETK